jgi:hypothetical protein
MDTAVWVAAIGATVSVFATLGGPPLLLYLKSRSESNERHELAEVKRLEKEQDNARQDFLADRAERSAKALIEQSAQIANRVAREAKEVSLQAANAVEETARVLEENTKAATIVAVETKEALSKLDRDQKIIHSIVNSGQTALMTLNYESTKRELVLLRHVVDLDRKAGREPTVDALAEIEAAVQKIAELNVALTDRLRQQANVDKEAGLAKASE